MGLKRFGILLSLLLASIVSSAQQPASYSPAVRAFVSVDVPVLALTHVRVIDGTGTPAREFQTIIVSGGKILALGDADATPVPAGAKVMEMHDHTVKLPAASRGASLAQLQSKLRRPLL